MVLLETYSIVKEHSEDAIFTHRTRVSVGGAGRN